MAADAVQRSEVVVLPTDTVYGDTHGKAELRLITCGGLDAKTVREKWPLVRIDDLCGGAWLGAKRFRSKAWRLDDDGFTLRRGRMWRSETRVPQSRS